MGVESRTGKAHATRGAETVQAAASDVQVEDLTGD